MTQNSRSLEGRQLVGSTRYLGEQPYLFMEVRDDQECWAAPCCSSGAPFAFAKKLRSDPKRWPRRHPENSDRGRPTKGVIIRKPVDDRTALSLIQAAWDAINRQFGYHSNLKEKARLFNICAPFLVDWWLNDQCGSLLSLDPKALLTLFESEAVRVLGERPLPKIKRYPADVLLDALERHCVEPDR